MTNGLASLAPSLAHPEWVVTGAAVVGAVAVCTIASWLLARRRARRLLGSARAVGARRLARDLSVVAAFAALALAVLGPHAGFETLLVPGAGVDVVLLLDVSRSMDAADVPPSRLARARELAAGLLERLEPDDRVALAAFASRGVLLVPLTTDTDALEDLLPSVDGDLIQERGSDLGAGVVAALAAFDVASERPRVVVAISDGEDPAGGAELGDAAARRLAARVVSIAVGSDEGAPVPDAGTPLLDLAGRRVTSQRNAARLAQLAEATDGAAFAANGWGEIDIAAALAAVRRDAGRGAPGELVPRRAAASRAPALALLAYVILCLEGAALPRRGRRAAALALLTLAGVGAADGPPAEAPFRDPPRAAAALEARLREAPGDARLLVALGVARAAGRQPEEARRALEAAALGARDPAITALAYYDLGVLALEQRDLAAARDAFFDALALDPSDAQARFNLERTLGALRATPPESPPEDARDPRKDRAERPEADRGRDPPRSPEAIPQPAQPAAEPGQGFAPKLDAQEVARWLDAVSDDAGRSLRSAAQADRAAVRPRPGVPQW